MGMSQGRDSSQAVGATRTSRRLQEAARMCLNSQPSVPQPAARPAPSPAKSQPRTSASSSCDGVLCGAALRDRRWAPNSLGRAGVLVVTAQILVGVMGMTLAAWFLMWAPALKFREVPHYAGVPVFLAGVCGAILISCFQRSRHSTFGSLIKVFQGVLVALCCVSVVTCLCVCIFTALHLTQLTAMTCHTEHSTLGRPVQSLAVKAAAPAATIHLAGLEDDEDEGEGSGAGLLEADLYDDVNEALEFETVTLESVTVSLDQGILLNITSCTCEQRGSSWRRRKSYPNLSCLEVNNILPILFVASCVVTAIGAVLSALILYLLWSFKNSFYGPAKPHERRPFIFTSNFKDAPKASNGSSKKVVNGDSRFR
ncbi:hypothetical protein GWK47_053156 [Chionoecetes opilio]|uniref:Uncharacterized protein n=1 Tax=Chionoecetes opilio TaxID=41210 RepID=A0A8J5CRF1_CHIOP|nr:hypothetical protein GWK47_053156 [Chionoecetes opilio]